MAYTEVFPGSSELVRGEVPSSSILLIGPTGIGKTIFSKQFILNGLQQNEVCIFVSTEENASSFFESFNIFHEDLKRYVENGSIHLVDCYSWRVTGSSTEKKSNPTDLYQISKLVEESLKGNRKMRFVLDSISGLSSSNDNESILKFVQIIAMKIRASGGKGIFIVDSGAHDEHFLTSLRRAMDGVIEMKSEETQREFTRLLRIFSLRGARHKTQWVPFEITDDGIKIKSDGAARCILCSKPITWEPYIEVIDGKTYHFDQKECANTYRKFRELYGEYFE